MSAASFLAAIGVIPATGSVDSSGSIYSFSQQQKDFIKLQFRYGLLLKQKLASGEITQDYYDSHLWLTTETLDPPYNGWLEEFKNAIQSEDLNWLAKQTGETVDALIDYMGTALAGATEAIGKTLGTAVSSSATGLVSGFFGSLNPVGWLVVIGLGVGLYYGVKKGYVQRTLKLVI